MNLLESLIFVIVIGVINLCTASWIYLPKSKNCKEQIDFSTREQHAEFIITGTVVSVPDDTSILTGKTYKGQVAVKRVIKGQKSDIQPISLILVENFGDRNICDSLVLKRDTKIFLLNKNPSTGNFRLDSNIIRLTLKNLDTISAHQKGKTFTTRAPIRETPCERIYCGYGSTCRIDPRTGQASCIDLEDRCGHQCKFGASCVGNYLTGWTCDCPATCDGLPKTHLPPDMFVCGTNNVTYENYCQLQLASCKEQRTINVDSTGVCGGCERVQCDFYSKCEIDQRGSPKCTCLSACPRDKKTVCGTDGVTYHNECELRKTACEQQRFIVVAAPFPCESIGNHLPSSSIDNDYVIDVEETGVGFSEAGQDAIAEKCDQKTCQKMGGNCALKLNDRTSCVCKFNCSLTAGSAVCGINAAEGTKRLFTNECFLKEYACQAMQKIVSHPPADCEDFDILPCYGGKPLQNNITHKDLFCGDGPHSRECPPGSYCHKSISTSFAKCCPAQETGLAIDCSSSQFGCCPDGITAAKGHHGHGCRKHTGTTGSTDNCKCNKIGSVSTTCDEETKQCRCRLGVSGSRCDRCQSGFWGLKKAAVQMKGCLPCGCSNFGSVRPDCEQMTGRCVCKKGVIGIKCDSCPAGQILQPGGCVSAESYPDKPSSCGELLCHLGAACVQRNGQAECLCNMTCQDNEPSQTMVCGSDGMSYASVCQLRIHACRFQKDITIVAWGPCGEGSHRKFVTVSPPVVTPLNLYAKHLSAVDNTIPRDTHLPTISLPAKQGQLGDSCDQDSECLPPNSACPRGKCVCIDGFDIDFETQQCKRILLRTSACHKNPCQNGGTCQNGATSSGSFECLCLPSYQGKICEELAPLTVPSFSGKSYFELKAMSGYTQLNIEMEFLAHNLDGILLYNGQKPDGSGDFVSLSLNNGFVEFRYDLGDSPALIRSSVAVTLGQRHRLIAKRFNQDGILKLDDHPEVPGRCPGIRKFLDLEESLFVGYVPTTIATIFDKIGTKNGFVGCMYSLKLGRRFVGLTDSDLGTIAQTGTIAAFEIGECGKNACASAPCLHGGTCEATTKTSEYRCTCKSGYSGNQCEVQENRGPSSFSCENCFSADVIAYSDFTTVPNCAENPGSPGCSSSIAQTPLIPDFQGAAFIELANISDINPHLNIETWFLTRKTDGLILYAGNSRIGDGDFISLNLRNGKLEFVFDLGHGHVNISYPETVSLDEWHSAKVERTGRRASLQLDKGHMVSGETQGTLAELNLETGVYLGGARTLKYLARSAKIDCFLDGVIQMVSINGGQMTDLMKEAIASQNIKSYEGHVCHQNRKQCLHGGYCIPRMASFKCKCTPGYKGERCEIEIPVARRANSLIEKSIHLDGHTFLEFPNMIHKSLESQERNSYKIRLRTSASNGLIIWQSRGSSIRGDYLAIAVVNGSIQFSYDLGKEQNLFAIQSTVAVNDGKWHHVHAEREKRSGILKVDEEVAVTKTSTPGTTILNTNGLISIGGSPDISKGLHASYYQGFEGCLSEVFVNNERVPLQSSSFDLQPCSERIP